ncbi:MAG: hypothetical protein LOD89_08445, partial [Tissierellales bacterium]
MNDIKDLPNEIWKWVPNFEGKIQVSNFGRCKIFYERKTPYIQIVKPKENSKGYLYFSYGGAKFIHRLVAEAFVENDDPINKTCVDHKDNNKHNN